MWGTVVLEWFGYEGDLRTQKRKFIDIKRNSIPYKELTSKEEIELYPTIKEEILSLPHKGAIACSKWLLMKPYDIKIAMLRLNTKIHKLLNNITSKWKSLSDCMLNTQRYLLKKKRTNV